MVREKVLSELEKNRGKRISGQQLAESIGVSRAAVWKAINSLKADGMNIISVTGGGYCLSQDDDTLNSESIKSLVKCKDIANEIIVLPEVSSTNTVLKCDYSHKSHGFVLIAEKQTAGRGRMGRAFTSPNGGVYMSILLKPKFNIDDLSFLTLVAAVSVCDAVRSCTGLEPQIKWVNDILLNGKKLCGILTEASIEGETGSIDYIALGIGINITTNLSEMPEQVRNIATSISEHCENPPRRAEITASILNSIQHYLNILFTDNGKSKIINLYSKNLCCINEKVCVYAPNETYEAMCLGINESGNLIVEKTDKSIHILQSGEIRIRPNSLIENGYTI